MAAYSGWMLRLRRFIKAWGDRRLAVNRRLHGATDGDEARALNYWTCAISHYERYLSRVPSDIGVRVRLANTFRESGDLNSAIAVLREAMASRPEKQSLRIILAEILDEAGFTGDALELLAQTQHASNGKDESRIAVEGDQNNPPAPEYEARQVHILVNVADVSDPILNATVESLQNQDFKSWRATIWGEGANAGILNESAAKDGRFVFDAERVSDHLSGPVLIIRAGTVLRRECLGWMLWALEDGVEAVYADHEANIADKFVPVLQSSPHPLDLETNPMPPAVVLLRERVEVLGSNFLDARMCLEGALQCGTVRHVPLVLASVPTSNTVAVTSSASTEQREVGGRILVIIPTRDEGAVLDVMLTSLFERASDRGALDVVVVDNGSQDVSTLSVLDRWRQRGVETLRRDEPFNWSSLNNAACEGRPQPIVVFANNDMEMLSDGWDLEVRRLLAMDNVGVVGARLLYPNDRVQHAGIVMGGFNGEPLHEGLRVGRDERGPLDRWVRRRPATAVTGAFMAMRRSVFDQVGGFDAENFAVSCNDVDFCLRAGATGWTILYAPELVLRHHESLSRGHANTESKQQRAAEEMRRLLARWGARARFDPTRNPQWEARGIRLFAGMRSLTTEEVMDWAIKTESRPFGQLETPTLA